MGRSSVSVDTLVGPRKFARTTLQTMSSLYLKVFRFPVTDTATFNDQNNNQL